METLAVQPPREKLKSFDLAANVRDMRHDIDCYGYVLPETREQVGNEQLSYLAEGSDRAARTTFVLRREGDELVYFADGQWVPYSTMLKTGLKVAEAEAMIDSRRRFLAEWAQNDLYHYSQIRRLRPGDLYIWSSSYAHHEEALYGTAFMQECGLVPDRKMGFLYRAYCQADGMVVLESQTVDRSDDEAFANALDMAELDPEADLDVLVRAYDSVLMKKYGGFFYAGRRSAELNENAWQQITANRDLVEYLLNGLEGIARTALPDHELEYETKRHIYGVWALFKKRLEGTARPITFMAGDEASYLAAQIRLTFEVGNAYQEFVTQGRPLIGCGGAITMSNGESDVMSMSSKDVFSSIFGNKGGEEKYNFDKKMYCVVCQAPPKGKEPKKLCGPCGICKKCDTKIKLKSTYALAA